MADSKKWSDQAIALIERYAQARTIYLLGLIKTIWQTWLRRVAIGAGRLKHFRRAKMARCNCSPMCEKCCCGPCDCTCAAEQAKPDECHCPQHGSWIAAEDIHRMVRDLDVAMFGKGAAIQAKLIDLMPHLLIRIGAYNEQSKVAEQAQAGEVYQEVGDLLSMIGWDARNDAQWSNLRDNLPRLAALLLRLAGGVTVDVPELRKVAKRNLRSLIERSGDSEKELMLKCLEELL